LTKGHPTAHLETIQRIAARPEGIAMLEKFS